MVISVNALSLERGHHGRRRQRPSMGSPSTEALEEVQLRGREVSALEAGDARSLVAAGTGHEPHPRLAGRVMELFEPASPDLERQDPT